MSVQEQIKDYINSQVESKRNDMQAIHRIILELMPACKSWFLDGRNDRGKIVSNPSIGYGFSSMKYADGSEKEFYRIGLSANTAGISVYIMGLADKNYLPKTYGKKLGKATVTGYCLKFKTLQDIELEILRKGIQYGANQI